MSIFIPLDPCVVASSNGRTTGAGDTGAGETGDATGGSTNLPTGDSDEFLSFLDNDGTEAERSKRQTRYLLRDMVISLGLWSQRNECLSSNLCMSRGMICNMKRRLRKVPVRPTYCYHRSESCQKVRYAPKP